MDPLRSTMADPYASGELPASLLVGGLHAGGSGYPNAVRTLQLLERQLQVTLMECGRWLPTDTALWRLSEATTLAAAREVLRIVTGNLASVACILRRSTGRSSWVYVPYPAVFFLWWMSAVPRRWRPRIIADAYISLWDSWACDRGHGTRSPMLSHWLKRFEAHALRSADIVLTDTTANKAYYIDTFGLAPEQVVAMPLAIEEEFFLALPEKLADSTATRTVLFVGTMIPLHGIDTILEAIGTLAPKPGVRFRLVGDGQMSAWVARFLTHCGRTDISWQRTWQSPHEIATEIANADVCLGIFGGTPKSERVLPFKLYMYLAAGKAIITQDRFSLPEGVPEPPFVTVPPKDSLALAMAIENLLQDDIRRSRLGSLAREYFQRHLASSAITRRWQTLLGSSPFGR